MQMTTGVEVVALDQLPLNETSDKMFIINTEKIDSKSDGHWLFLSKKTINNETTIVYMDSMGLPPFMQNIIMYINNNINGGTLICNKNVIQSEKSATCGMFCIMCANCLQHNLGFNSFLRRYSGAPEQNDEKVLIDFKYYKRERGAK